MIIGAFALVVGLTLYTLLDALRTHQDQMRTFPQMAVDYCGDLLSRCGSSPVAFAGSPARRANS